MKKLYFLILFVSIQFCAQAVPAAQDLSGEPPFTGQVELIHRQLAQRGDSLYVEFDIRVHEQSLNKSQSWTIIPRLSTRYAENSVIFPHVLINGKGKAQQFMRRIHFENEFLLAHMPYSVTEVKPGEETIINYAITIPYRMWMDSASMEINQILTSKGWRDQLFVLHDMATVDLEPHFPYQTNPQLNFIEPPKEQKKRTLKGEAFLDFQLGRSVIIPTFRRNPEELAKISGTLDKVKNDEDVKITGLFIEGYASPEGNYASNERLSWDRAVAFKEYMRHDLGLGNELFQVKYVAEDWEGFRLLVAESSIPQKDRILEIIDSNDTPDRKEQRIKALRESYTTILTEMFPQLRRVEYQVDFTVRDYNLEETALLAATNPERLSQLELFRLAGSYGDNIQKRNEIYDLILRMYPDDITANINAAAVMLSRSEDNAAKRYMDKIGASEKIFNNLGVYYLKVGQLDMAEEFFTKAAAAGIVQAQHNLREVQLKRADNKIMERYNRK